jgi:hypothetical protein
MDIGTGGILVSMSNPSNHPPDGDPPTVQEPAAADPVAPQTPPAAGPVPPADAPPPPPAAPPGAGWAPQPPPGAWRQPGYRRPRPLILLIAVGVLGILLGCVLGGAVTLIATNLHDGWHRVPARPAPVYGPRRVGPGFAPGNRPGFGPNRGVQPAKPSPSPTG